MLPKFSGNAHATAAAEGMHHACVPCRTLWETRDSREMKLGRSDGGQKEQGQVAVPGPGPGQDFVSAERPLKGLLPLLILGDTGAKRNASQVCPAERDEKDERDHSRRRHDALIHVPQICSCRAQRMEKDLGVW